MHGDYMFQITIPLCDDPGLLGRQQGLACGVLTLSIKGGENGRATTDTQWCSVTMDKEKIRTKPITSDSVVWTERMSFIVRSLRFDKLRIKLKGKRVLGPNWTICEYTLSLADFDLEDNPVIEKLLERENIRGSDLQVTLNYTSLPVLQLSNSTEKESFENSYLTNIKHEQPPKEVAGVLLVCVHEGHNLLQMDPNGKSDPYVMIYANSEEKHVGPVKKETLDPEWDTRVEFFTTDYTKTVLTFFVHDSDRNTPILSHLISTADEDDFMGSCNMKLTEDDWCVFKRPLDLLYKIHGNRKHGTHDKMSKAGQITVSVLFRPVPVVAKTVRGSEGRAMNEGEPIFTKSSKIDAHTVEAMIRSERGSLTVSILRARNLIALDMNGLSDPFVSVRVGNSNQEKYKTKVIGKTLNPVWNESVTMAMVQRHEKLHIELFDKDTFTQERMGTVSFDYTTLLELAEGEAGEEPRWYQLKDAKSGEVQLAFKAVAPVSSSLSASKDSFKRAKGGGSLLDLQHQDEFDESSGLKNDSEDSEDSDFMVYEEKEA